jgi:hypothetical protein
MHRRPQSGETSLRTAAAARSADQRARAATGRASASILGIATAVTGLIRIERSFLGVAGRFRNGLKMAGLGVDAVQAILTRSVRRQDGKRHDSTCQKGGLNRDFHRWVPGKGGGFLNIKARLIGAGESSDECSWPSP